MLKIIRESSLFEKQMQVNIDEEFSLIEWLKGLFKYGDFSVIIF
jgi:hypothetical protein